MLVRILILLFIFVISGCRKENESADGCFLKIPADTYAFPMTSLSADWSNYYPEEIWHMNQLPDSVLENISTEGLLETCLTFPFYGDIGLSDYHQFAFDYYSEHFNGAYELLKRNNSSTCIYNRYISMSPFCGANNYPDFSGRGEWLSSAFVAVEMFLAQYDVLNRFGEEQLKETGKEALLKFNQKVLNPETNSIFNVKFSLLICGRILQLVNYEPFVLEYSENADLKLFIDQVYAENDEVLKMVEKYYKKYLTEN